MQLQAKFGCKPAMDKFLFDHNMHPNLTHMAHVMVAFRQHMSLGLAGKEHTRLMMLPTYVQLPKNLPAHQPVLVMDAGGTNLRKALVCFDEQGQPITQEFSQCPMPGADGQILEKQAFYDHLASVLDGQSSHHQKAGFCFSYPVRVGPDGDGEILLLSKEIHAPSCIGTKVGKELCAAALARNPASTLKKVLVVNDTVTTLLSGMLGASPNQYSSYIGFILGTGMNMAYVESNAKITKVTGLDPNSSQVINLEAGDFNALHRGDMDHLLDQQTTNPGSFCMEKMMSGAYLGRLAAISLEYACKEHLFDEPTTSRMISVLDDLTTKDLSAFFNNHLSGESLLHLALKNSNPEQAELAGQLIAGLLQRLAKILAASLGALVVESSQGLLASQPVCISIDGTTFYAFEGLEQEIERLLKEEVLVGTYRRYFVFKKVSSASLVGTAIATYAF
jgi:hexokinase